MKKDLLKIVSWISTIAVSLVIITAQTTQDMKSYLWEGLAFLGILLYAYKQIKYRMLVLVYAGIFTLIYAFINFSPADFIIWLIIFILILIEKE